MASCIICNRPTHKGQSYCCPGCEAVHTVINSMELDGDEREQKVLLQWYSQLIYQY